MAHEDPRPRGRPDWLDPVHLPSGSLALWVRVAEAFCGLKMGSPGSVLRVLGSFSPVPSRLVSGGQRDSWDQVRSGWERGSLSLAVLPLGRQTASRGAELSLLTEPPPLGHAFHLCPLWDSSFSFPFPVISESPRLRRQCWEGPPGSRLLTGRMRVKQGRGGLGPAPTAG